MTRLLRELEQKDNRKARFRTIIALMIDGNITTFEGIVNGEIIRERRGGEGFGYDPIFQPEGYSETFAELGTGIKNQISHRARATQKLANYLKKLKA
jgi:non-canonical purine NTP pyrophosphatase (RdgB/HAM1 family)